jgi:hypothetical protein
MYKKLFSILLIFSVLALYSCKTDTKTDETVVDDTPILPPQSTMLDLYSINQSRSISQSIKLNLNESVRATDQSEFLLAGIFVIAWNAGLAFILGPPVAAFKYVISQKKATKINDNTWVWQAQATVNSITYTGELTGTKVPDTSKVTWSMKISSSTLDKFEWFTGECDYKATNGYWQFYDPQSPLSPKMKFRLDYTVNSSTDLTAKIENNDPLPDSILDSLGLGYGTYIEYKINGTAITLTGQGSKESNPTIVSWDSITKAGSLRRNDGVTKGCWDSSHNTIPCP